MDYNEIETERAVPKIGETTLTNEDKGGLLSGGQYYHVAGNQTQGDIGRRAQLQINGTEGRPCRQGHTNLSESLSTMVLGKLDINQPNSEI